MFRNDPYEREKVFNSFFSQEMKGEDFTKRDSWAGVLRLIELATLEVVSKDTGVVSNELEAKVKYPFANRELRSQLRYKVIEFLEDLIVDVKQAE